MDFVELDIISPVPYIQCKVIGLYNKETQMPEKSYRIHIKHGEFELDIEGDRKFVESYVDTLLAEGAVEEMGAEPKPRKRRERRAAPAAKRAPSPRRKQVPEIDKKELAAFMDGKKLTSNKEKYLEYMRYWKTKGVDEVADAHIHACFLAGGKRVPPTGRQHFSSLRNEGLVRHGSTRGLWTLTKEGLQGEPPRRRRGPRAATSAQKARTGRKKAVKAGRQAAGKGGRKTSRRIRPPKSVAEVMGLPG